MGGSSSSFRYEPVEKRTIIQKIQEADDQTDQHNYELEINNLLTSLLGQFNNRDTELIKQHIDTILSALNDQIEGNIVTKFGGSLNRHTHLNGISDVDALVILNNSELANGSPQEVLDYFHKVLIARLPKTNIEKTGKTVTLHYSDGDIQLIPALRTKTGIKIPDNQSWSTVIKPEAFRDRLTALNYELNNRLVPAIKLIKGIIAGFPERSQLKGYHVESLAVEIFSKEMKSEPILKNLVTCFFQKSAQLIQKPIKDVTGQSLFVDEYLGKKESFERIMTADNLERTFRQIELADTGRIKSIWNELFSHMK
jgi:hypothetical protein